ncbi:MAG: exodeoxyribonuclease VII large subunit [Pseudomonadota bacterium]
MLDKAKSISGGGRDPYASAMTAPFTARDVDGARGDNAPEYTVSELARSVRRTVEDRYGFVRVRGEIGGFRGRHSSGHGYFSLKDADAAIDAVVWRSAWGKLSIKPEEGLEVVASGRMTTFAKKSSYQLVVEQLEVAGVGALMKLLEERRKKLAAEGLFADDRKRPLPYLPGVIGVVTSPTGSVIRDILHRVADRFPSHVVVWPVRVQGETSGAEAAAAVAGFAQYNGPRPDVIIVARGGGSVEDLWGFNDETLVRAVAASAIPVISAVGHETDWTLIDHAADHRAPTPTGAAERAVPVRAECLATLADRARRLDLAASAGLAKRRQDLRLLARALADPARLLEARRQRLDLAADRLAGALTRRTARSRQRFTQAGARLTPATLQHPIRHARSRLFAIGERLVRAAETDVRARADHHARLSARLSPRLLMRMIGDAGRRADALSQRLQHAGNAALLERRRRFTALAKLLDAVSYQGVLARGFALVREKGSRTPVRRADGIAPGAELDLEFGDGSVGVRAEGGEATAAPAKAMRKAERAPRRSKRVDDRQGHLF